MTAFSRSLLLSLILLLPGGTLHADLLVYDGFDYAPEATLHGQNGGVGFEAPWIESAFGTDLDVIVGASLQFDTLRTSGGAVASTAPVLLTTDLTRDVQNIVDLSGTTLWLSFLLRKETQGGTPPEDYFGLALYSTSGDGLCIGDPFENDFYTLGVAGSDAGLVPSAVPVTPSVTRFLVVQISFLDGADMIRLFVDPTPDAPEPVNPAAIKTDFDLRGVDMLGILAGSSTANPRWSFDEIRIGREWADVAPSTIPEPGAGILVSAGGVLLLQRRRRNRAR